METITILKKMTSVGSTILTNYVKFAGKLLFYYAFFLFISVLSHMMSF